MWRSTNGDAVGQWTYSNNDAQKWERVTVGKHIKLKNKATGKFLDGLGLPQSPEGTMLGQWSDSSSFNQQWSINLVGSSQSQSAKLSSLSKNAISEESSLPIVLYPNPFSSTFNLKVDEPNK